MLSYLGFIHHGIASAGEPLADGETLARNCLKKLNKLDDPEQFPPRLLILLASPAYLDAVKAEQLLSGIFQVFDAAGHEDLELIGCSAAAIFFDKHVYRRGALLVCLASRLLEANVSVSPDITNDSDRAINKGVKALLTKLELLTRDNRPVQSFGNRTLFTFFPGFSRQGYMAPKLHESLRTQLGSQMPIFGGVASGDDPERIRPGFLFAKRRVYRKALVAATIECGTPFGMSLTQGLEDTDKTYTVSELSPSDPRVITRFQEGTASEIWEGIRQISPVPLFANLELDRDRIVDLPVLEGEAIKMGRQAQKDELFRLMIPEPAKMHQAFREGVKRSLMKAWLLNPIGGLGFRCAGLLRHSRRIGIDLNQETALIEHDLSERDSSYPKPFIGGFVDGEASVDGNGKSVLGNWSNATLAFGDELRFRTPVYRGFDKMAAFAARKGPETYGDAIDRLTRLVYDIGFPGAMLSLWQQDDEHDAIIAQAASGSRFKKVLGVAEPIPVDSMDLIAVVAREKRALPVINSRSLPGGSMKAASQQGIISQYIAPLVDEKNKVRAILQIGLGDISYDTALYPSETSVLDALTEIVKSGLNRAFSREQHRIIRDLDQAMKACLSAETIKQGLQDYLTLALTAFGLTKGHIRIANREEHSLKLVVGTGEYFEETRKARPSIDFGDRSPTAQAFRNEKVIIINDARHHSSHQEMCERWKKKRALHERLREIGSYANIPFKSEGGERGTINLVSADPWFFSSYHDVAINALSERVGFLLENLRRKQQESFLVGVSPQFSEIEDLNNVSEVLKREVNRFADAMSAQFASLYLWHEGRGRFILQAQHGWVNPEFLNVAYYKDNEQWSGSTALGGIPRHIPDLFDFYQNNPLCVKRYSEGAFGAPLSVDFTVEAVAVELRVAKHRLGVLTLYRKTQPGTASRFFTTDSKLLQRGADSLAGLIAILEVNRREMWRAKEHERRQEVYGATVSGAPSEFEARVCKQVLVSYHARKVRFYKTEIADEGPPRIELKASFELNTATAEVVEAAALSSGERGLVGEVVRLNRKEEKRVKTENEEDLDHSQRTALANRVKRVCIPLVSEKKLIGVLDLHWPFSHKPANSLNYEHSESHLLVLGEIIGSAYRRTQAKISLIRSEKKMDRSSLAVQVTSAYVLQHQHELGKIVQNMIGLLEALERAFTGGSPREQRSIIDELSRHCTDSSQELTRIVDIGSRVVDQADENISVRSLVHSALAKKRNRLAALQISVNHDCVDNNLHICADPALFEIVLTNLIDNAIDSMIKQEKRGLEISATANADGERITLALKDTGVGMSQDALDQMPMGFFQRQGHISLGVPINRMILAIYGARIEYDSVEGRGTEARIVFPINYRE
jgi:signal transduction histidine kinase